MKHNNKKQDRSPKVPQRDKISQNLDLKEFNWTDKQKKFIELATNKETKIIFVNGPAGSSKTLLAVYVSLLMLNQRKVSDILYLRAAIESSDAKLGFLPGDLNEKIHFYGLPLLDKLNELLPPSQADKLVEDQRVSIFPVGFTRGLNWNAKAVIVDESQNLVHKELVTILTRLGKFTKCFVLADPDQSDINGKSGAFVKISEAFNDKAAADFGIHQFTFDEDDIMRSELVKFLVKRFNMIK
jgi:phosphate starvation-inducible PhoH-like protein